jgi:hypothetical protein
MGQTSNQNELLDPGLADWLDPLATARAFHGCMARLRLKDNKPDPLFGARLLFEKTEADFNGRRFLPVDLK